MTFEKIQLGQEGEELAVQFLKRHGYRILKRNYRTRLGEIDVVAEEGGAVCFVEVKTRMSARQGAPLEAIPKRKQSKLARMALVYLNANDQNEVPARFDVVAVSKGSNGEEAVELIKNAFDLGDLNSHW